MGKEAFEAAKNYATAWSDHIVYKNFDIEEDLEKQNVEASFYDVIVAVNLRIGRRSLDKTICSVLKLLKSGCNLILLDIIEKTMATSLIFGTLPG